MTKIEQKMTKEGAIRSLSLLDKTATGELYYDVNFGHTKIGSASEVLDTILGCARWRTDDLFPKELFTREFVTDVSMKVPPPCDWDAPDVIVRFKFDKDKLMVIAHS